MPVNDGKVISSHAIYGPKVVLLPNGDYLKVFNPKSGFTKRHFFPKYKSFINNAEKLHALGVPTITIKEVTFNPEHRSYTVRYAPLAGKDLRELAHEDLQTTLSQFIPFLASLHEKGIYFRGIHLGNVLQLHDGSFGLIDMADLYCKRGALSAFMRARNLAHLLKNKDDRSLYQQFGIEKFIEGYLKYAEIKGISAQFIKTYLKSISK